MEGELDLVLEIDIGVWEERQKLFHIGWHVIEQIGFDKCSHGWRSRCADSSQYHLCARHSALNN
jgi:hypothetical protein